jgi:hypothetical protein
MKREVKILCPNKRCKKCIKFIQRVEEIALLSDNEIEIEVIDKLDKTLNYSTWILPALVVNNKVVIRGYIPSKERLLELYNKV